MGNNSEKLNFFETVLRGGERTITRGIFDGLLRVGVAKGLREAGGVIGLCSLSVYGQSRQRFFAPKDVGVVVFGYPLATQKNNNG